jgi:8-oxo-dGTP diphosphatase
MSGSSSSNSSKLSSNVISDVSSTSSNHPNVVHVAVGILQNEQGKILLAKRAKHQHQGGLWEFPGGKVESGESVFDALVREFIEEVGVKIIDAEPFQKIQHVYRDNSGDKEVLLDVWLSRQFEGVAQGKENQAIAWVDIQQLEKYSFPQANQAIIDQLIAMS